jgi:hypothetical protein
MAQEIYIEKFFSENGNVVQIKYYSDIENRTFINLKKIDNYTYVVDESTQEIIEKTIITDYYKGEEIIKTEQIKEYINK